MVVTLQDHKDAKSVKPLREIVDAIFEGEKEERDRLKRYWEIYKGKMWDESSLGKNETRAMYNLIFSTVMTIAPMMTDSVPMAFVVPQFAFLDKLAKAYNDALRYAWDVVEFQKKSYEVVLTGLVKGIGLYKVYYDPEAPYGGDICIDSVDPCDFFIAPGYDDPWKAPFCGERKEMPLSYFKKRWPDKASKIKPEKGFLKSDRDRGMFKFGSAKNYELAAQSATLYEIWIKDCEEMEEYYEEVIGKDGAKSRVKKERKKYPNGKIVYFTKDDILLEEVANPFSHGYAPYVPFWDYRVPGSFLGMGEPVQIDGLNKELNLQLHRLLDYTRKYHNPSTLIDSSVFTDVEGVKRKVEEGGHTIPFDGSRTSGQNPIRLIDYPQLIPEVYNVLTLIPQIAEQVTGVTDVSKGIAAKKAEQSASEVAILLEASNSRTRQRVRNHEDAIKRVTYLLVRLMQQYYTEQRDIRYIDDGQMVYSKFGSSYLASNRIMQPQDGIIDRQVRASSAIENGEEPDRADILDPQEQQEYEDYKAFVEAFKGEDNDLDPVYFDFTISVQTNSTLPLDRQSLANLALRLAQTNIAPESPLDKKALLDILQFPGRDEIMNRMDEKQAGPQGAQGGGQPQPGMTPMPEPQARGLGDMASLLGGTE